MTPEVEQVILENNLRRQHKFTWGWNKADQADQNAWERHDNNRDLDGSYLTHGMPYGICTVCEYLNCQS